VADYLGLRGKSSLYDRVRAGLMPPPIKLSAKVSVWPEHEIAAVMQAAIAGAGNDAVRDLVVQLVAARGGESAEQIRLREAGMQKARAMLAARAAKRGDAQQVVA
jgi:prophage regulatory protein